MAENSVKILMIGARRAGKTSVLAGLVDIFKRDTINSILKVEDITPDKNVDTKLSGKIEEIKNILKNNVGKTILVDESPTNTFYNYIMKVSLPQDNGSMELTFTDGNGEFYSNGDNENVEACSFEEAKEHVQNYDIIIVAIDTPYLMESINPQNELCTKTLNKAYNQVQTTNNLLLSVGDNDGENAKLVIFVPIKCELWAKRGQLDEVTKRVEEVYDTSLTALSAYRNIEVVVMPVQTIGNIVFDSHREAYVLSTKTGKYKCSVSEDDKITLGNGIPYKLKNDDILNEDLETFVEGYNNFKYPRSWYKIIGTEYAPRNCEQLAYYILQFVLVKTLNAKKKEEQKKKKGKWWKAAGLAVLAATGHAFFAVGLIAYAFLSKRMGTMKIEKLQEAIKTIQSRGLWKDSCDGIKTISKGLVLKEI